MSLIGVRSVRATSAVNAAMCKEIVSSAPVSGSQATGPCSSGVVEARRDLISCAASVVRVREAYNLPSPLNLRKSTPVIALPTGYGKTTAVPATLARCVWC